MCFRATILQNEYSYRQEKIYLQSPSGMKGSAGNVLPSVTATIMVAMFVVLFHWLRTDGHLSWVKWRNWDITEDKRHIIKKQLHELKWLAGIVWRKVFAKMVIYYVHTVWKGLESSYWTFSVQLLLEKKNPFDIEY